MTRDGILPVGSERIQPQANTRGKTSNLEPDPHLIMVAIAT